MPPARRRIRRFLDKAADVEIVGECGDGAAAVESIRALRPDLVFLDVQMPELDGFGVLARLAPTERPAVVFVTAHDEHALRAFEVHALDYLLKPFDSARFERALERARREVANRTGGDLDRRLDALLRQLAAAPPQRVAVKTRGRTLLVAIEDVDWIGAEGNYLALHVGSDIYLIRDTMNAFQQRLDARRFLRIHRSTIVNLDRVRDYAPLFNGDQCLRLKDGTELTVSRNYYDALKRALGAD